MASKPRDFQPDKIPDEFDLDVRFEEPKIPGTGFQTRTLADCPDGTEFFCPGPGPETGCTCYGATGLDTNQGPTCLKMCGETRGKTCVKFCIDTLRARKCVPVFTRRPFVATCNNTCANTCGNTCGCPPAATGTCICG